MLSPDLVQACVLSLGAFAAAAATYSLLFPLLSRPTRIEQRLQNLSENRAARQDRKAKAEQAVSRRKAIAETLRELEERQRAKEKVTIGIRLQRAGLRASPNTFWITCAASGLLCGALMLALWPSGPSLIPVIAVLVGTFGVPPWILVRLTRRRQARFLDEFANAIDIVVRGVRSGLPLNDCLGIVARESPSPVGDEFRELVEQQRVGMPLVEGFERMILRLPLTELKFFAIVIAIQQQAGGNLSEALDNLSSVLRDRKRLHSKVLALAAEAKASAAVLGGLPFVVTLMVYFTTPNYIAILWTTRAGQFLLCSAAVWMLFGILVMRKMINFKY